MIGPVCGHGVKGIRHGQDFGAQGDLFVLKTPRIPFAVRPFVVTMDIIEGRP